MSRMMKNAVTAAAVVMMITPVLADNVAPGFELPDVNGEQHSLEQYAGKIVVLEWTNYDCPFVVKFYSVGAMQGWQEKYTGEGVVWLIICSSAPGKQGNFTQEEWLRRMEAWNVKATAVLLDEDGTVGRAYNARNTPQMVVISADGKLLYNGAIDDKRSASSEDIKGARNYVVEILDALLAGEEFDVPETQPYGCTVKY